MDREIGSQTMVVPFGEHEGKVARILKREAAANHDAVQYQLEVEDAVFWLTVPDRLTERASEGRLQRELGT